jgi:hypothetical protein
MRRPPPLIILAHPCLSMHRLHLPPPICLSFAPAGFCVDSCGAAFATLSLNMPPPPLKALAVFCIASHCATFATHPLNAPPPLNAMACYSDASCCPTSAPHPPGVLLPLDPPPPPPTFICLLLAPAVDVVLLLILPPLPLILSMRAPSQCTS